MNTWACSGIIADSRVPKTYGIQFDAKNLQMAVIEASDGKVGSTLDRIIL